MNEDKIDPLNQAILDITQLYADYNNNKITLGQLHDGLKSRISELIREAEIRGMEKARSRVLRRTEIPKDAKNPTRDVVVEVGEVCAEIIAQDIIMLKEEQLGKSENE